ncbi:MAG: hypothetical protein GWN67_15150 [Phycisphaerae bacterium]|nr:hypothetical protein [Phycisphaerae bacterium]NIP53443.1 hypothetical protein [Phycisphaerae bacterium]NIS52693.1 hypothetical protein [Phycisphaerae bacterium]NIU09935.1 hypothetical protein [Phycisphaerae bacterium]NIU57673.1 hypothetical protein [Phycisphaerae bacterium]
MESLSLRFDNEPRKPTDRMYAAFSTFRYEDGYTLSAVDLGVRGVKIELNQTYDDGAAIILPPNKVQDCGRWLLQTLGQDSYGLPRELKDILARLINHKKAAQILERGDKTKIKNALKVLRSDNRKIETQDKVFRLISSNAI